MKNTQKIWRLLLCLTASAGLLWTTAAASPQKEPDSGFFSPGSRMDTQGLPDGVIFEQSESDVALSHEAVQFPMETQSNTLLSAQTGDPVISGITLNTGGGYLVAGYAANISVTITGENLNENTLYVYLDNGTSAKVAHTLFVNNKATLHPAAADLEMPGDHYRVVVEYNDEELAFAPLEVMPLPDYIWNPFYHFDGNGNLQISFVTPVQLVPGVTIADVPASVSLSADKMHLTVNKSYKDIVAGAEIKISKVKYKEYFTSYALSFTTSFVPGRMDTHTVRENQEFYLSVNAKAQPTADTVQVFYDPEALTLLDAAAQTPEANIVKEALSDVEITYCKPGILIFKSLRQGDLYTAVSTLLKWQAQGSGEAKILIKTLVPV